MRSQKQMTLLGLGGGVALASAAFAIGSQAGGGSAVAGESSAAPAIGAAPTIVAAKAPATDEVHLRGPGGPRGVKPLGDLATRLGVDEAKLKAALEDLRPERKEIDGHAAELATILKLDEAKVRAALEKLRPAAGDRRRAPAFLVDELAKDLDLDEAKVRAAIEKAFPGRPGRGERPDKDAMLSALAQELGVDAARVRESLSDVRGPGRHHRHGPGGPGGPISEELAEELGVSTEALDKAFETLHERKRAEFARQLAAKLGISAENVEEVLREIPHRGGRGHHR